MSKTYHKAHFFLKNINRSYTGIIMLIVFGLLIYLPPVVTLFSPHKAFSVAEKRNLADFPDFQIEKIENFLVKIERYYRDQIAFRQVFISVYHAIKFFIFNTSPHAATMIGENGWLFFTSENSLEDVLGKVHISEKNLNQWQCALESRKSWLEDQGIRYLLVVAPDKQSIYPEYLPDKIRQRIAPQKRLDQLMEYMQVNSDVPILDLRKPLLDAKQFHQVYYRTDTHWNWQGGWVAYNQIMAVVRDWFPVVDALPRSRVLESPQDYTAGDLNRSISNLLHESEVALFIPDPCAMITDRPFNPLSMITICQNAPLRVIVFHDSFFCAVTPFLSETFGITINLWKFFPAQSSYDHQWLKQLIREYKPDLVIEERVERFLGATPKLTLEERFDFSTNELLRIDSGTGFTGVLPQNDLLLAPQPDRLDVHATGGDPRVLLPTFLPARSPIIMKIDLFCPDDTTLQVFYLNRTNLTYTEKQSRRHPVKKGENVIYIMIEEPELTGNLRLDPGDIFGNYVIRSIQIRDMEPCAKRAFRSNTGFKQ
ncbi:MAG: hypothetical protein AB7S77_18285 [Desulfatirhabdiaceae bacterium]